MRQAKAQGFEVHFIFVALKNAELSIQRVRERSALGGHFVPSDDVRRRYIRSLTNAPTAIRIADSSLLFDNSLSGHRKIMEARHGVVLWAAPQLPDWARRVLSDLESSKAQQA